jgi:ascorbate-specific PTS system EIIC-type component UlaA
MINLFKFLNIFNLNILKLRIIILLLYLKYLIYIFYEKKIYENCSIGEKIKKWKLLNRSIDFNPVGILIPFY